MMTNLKAKPNVSMSNVLFITGKAGTGKTSKAISAVSHLKDNEAQRLVKPLAHNEAQRLVIFLTYTNLCVENLKQRIAKEGLSFDVQTLHHFFHIGLDKNMNNIIIFNLLKYLPKVIIIDEFSLIPFDIFDLIFDYAKRNTDTKFILVGDILQLSSIQSQSIDMSKALQRVAHINESFKLSDLCAILSHLSSTPFFTDYFINSKKCVLTTNYRNGRSWQDIALNNIITLSELKGKLTDFTILAATKKTLSRIGTSIGILSDNYPIKTQLGNVKEDEKCIGYSTDLKGICPAKDFNDEDILPIRLLTVHKSQGMEFDKLLVLVDDMDKYDISLLYTAITRGKGEIIISSLTLSCEEVETLIKNNISQMSEMERLISFF